MWAGRHQRQQEAAIRKWAENNDLRVVRIRHGNPWPFSPFRITLDWRMIYRVTFADGAGKTLEAWARALPLEYLWRDGPLKPPPTANEAPGPGRHDALWDHEIDAHHR
jgi:hypothetical protein